MKVYEFSIIATGLAPNSVEFERIYELRGGDGRIVLCNGQIIVNFTRFGYSLATAMESAVADMRATGLTIVAVKQAHTALDSDTSEPEPAIREAS